MIKIAVVYGGVGSEYEVSLSSAKNILENIDREKFEILEVLIKKDKKFLIENENFDEKEGIEKIKYLGVKVVFPVVHGTYGEDGELQSKLEHIGLSYVGSESKVSVITIDKHKTNKILMKNNIHIPRSTIIDKIHYQLHLTFPIIIKPVNEGSSVHLYRFENQEEYMQSRDEIFKNKSLMLAQEFIQGREFTCGVIEKNGEVIPLLPTEIILTKSKLFDYTAKYTPDGCQEITPAAIDANLTNRIQELAVSCHTILNCRSISRTDMILKDDTLYVLEINTMPGMTKTSFIPAEAAACGYSMKELITMLVESIPNL